MLSGGGAAAGGGSSALGGPTSPRAAAPSAAAPQDPGRRHLNQDGSRAGTCDARAQRVGTRKCGCPAGCGPHRGGAPHPPPPMAQEQGLGARALPGSQTLLDALLRNLYDLGECGAPEPTWETDWPRRVCCTFETGPSSALARGASVSFATWFPGWVQHAPPTEVPFPAPHDWALSGLSLDRASRAVPECGRRRGCSSEAPRLSGLQRVMHAGPWAPEHSPPVDISRPSGKPACPTPPSQPRVTLVPRCHLVTVDPQPPVRPSPADFRERVHGKLFTAFPSTKLAVLSFCLGRRK